MDNKLPQKKKHNFSMHVRIGFIGALVILLVESNFFVQWAIVDVFNITSTMVQTNLAAVLIVLSLGFILVFILERYSASFFTRVCYHITSMWMGTLIYLLLASVIYVFTDLIFGRNAMFGMVLFALAIVVSIYGYIHGKKIVIKKIEVEIPNLPKAWVGRSAVFASDFHLGIARTAKFSQKVTQVINSLSPDIIFIGGDLYDGTHAPDPYVIAKPLENLKAPLGTLYISGNHEEFGDASPFFATVAKLGMKMIQDGMVDIDGLQIIGVDYLTCHSKEQFQKVLKSIPFDKTKPSVLLKHEPKDLEVGEEAGISFQISGHTHNGQQWPFNLLTNLIYKGYGYGHKHKGNMDVYVSSGVGGWGPEFRVASDCEVVLITFK